MIWAIAMNVSFGWMNEKIPPRTSSTPRIAFSAFHHPLRTTAMSANSNAPAIRKTIPARMPIDLAELRLNRNMISDRISQSVPVIRKTHHQLP